MTQRQRTPQAKPRSDLGNGVRYGALQFAVAVLGNAIVGHITGAYAVTEISGDMSIVRLRDGQPHCLTCKSGNDDHTSLVRLYLARLGQPCPKGA